MAHVHPARQQQPASARRGPRPADGAHRYENDRVLLQGSRQASAGGSADDQASWLTIPATAENEVPFDVEVDGSQLPAAGDFTETIRASADGFDDADCVVMLAVRPEGPKP